MQKSVKVSMSGINAKTGGLEGKRMPSAEPSPFVLTIGHSTRTLEEFIGLIQAHGATRVVDVRTVPRSDCALLTTSIPCSFANYLPANGFGNILG